MQVAQFIFSNKQDTKLIYQSRASYFALTEFEKGAEKFQLTQTADTQEKNSISKVIIQSIYENQ